MNINQSVASGQFGEFGLYILVVSNPYSWSRRVNLGGFFYEN